MTELCDLSAVELRALIGKGECHPLDLLESCFARMDKVNGALNAVVLRDEERARAAANEAGEAVARGETLGLLHGLPVGIKDLNETAGLKTTMGSLAFKDYVPDFDDTIVARVRAAGGNIACKTNTPEFGAGANTVNKVYGFTGNPLDPGRSCGGSSGGSAVALAASMVPLASGSDLGGSLRTPAAYSGVVGYRPTPGLVPSEFSSRAWSPLSVQGPMARSVPDLCLLLAALVGETSYDPLSRPARAEDFLGLEDGELSGLKVAFTEDLGFAPVDNDIRATFRDRVAQIAPYFAQAENRDPDLGDADHTFEVLRAVGFVGSYREIVERYGDDIGPNVRANVALGETFSAEDVGKAATEQTALYRRFVSFMEDVDLLIAPVASVPPIAEGQLFPTEINGKAMNTYISWMGITFGLTLTTHPVVVLPCGLDHTGTPFALQVVGRFGDDARLLSIAQSLEKLMAGMEECRPARPDLEALANWQKR